MKNCIFEIIVVTFASKVFVSSAIGGKIVVFLLPRLLFLVFVVSMSVSGSGGCGGCGDGSGNR